MQSSGVADRVHCSPTTYEAVKGMFSVSHRRVFVKSKGDMTTYLIEGANEPEDVAKVIGERAKSERNHPISLQLDPAKPLVSSSHLNQDPRETKIGDFQQEAGQDQSHEDEKDAAETGMHRTPLARSDSLFTRDPSEENEAVEMQLMTLMFVDSELEQKYQDEQTQSRIRGLSTAAVYLTLFIGYRIAE